MKIKVDKVTEEPIQLKEMISAGSWDIDGYDIKFVGDISLDSTFQLCGEEILVTTFIKADRQAACARCLKDVRDSFDGKLQSSYSVRECGDTLDIDEDVREYILLNFPMRILCSDDCKGICVDCGVDLNIDRCKCSKKDNFVNKIRMKGE